MNKKQIKESLRSRLLESKDKKVAAGVLVLCTETNKVLLLLRSQDGHNGGTWNLVAGAIEEGETPLEGLKREVNEEMSVNPDIIDYKFIEKIELPQENKDFHYYTGFTKSEFIPKLCDENTDYGWFTKDDLPTPLYPKIKAKLDKIWKNQI